MVKVIGVRFRTAGKIYFFDPLQFEIERGGHVIVETARGIEFGTVVSAPREVEDDKVIQPLKPVLRIATQKDIEQEADNKRKEKEAFRICLEKIKKHGLEMKLIDAEYTFDNNKVLFYFTADGRIDFRELVKDLASVFKTRIELRQIGVRDETKIVGGIGICGRPLCCHTHLSEFIPVSIKMAKEQNLSLNPTKISGVCGRLMCCLKHEEDTYEELNRKLPNVGDFVTADDGTKGEVQSVNVLRQLVKVIVDVNDEKEVREYKVEELQFKRKHGKKEKLDLSAEELKELEKLEEEEIKETAEENAELEDRDGGKSDNRRDRRNGQNRGSRKDNRNRQENGRGDRSERAERADRGERAERADRGDRAEHAERTDRGDRAERAERTDRGDRAERPERTERFERRGERPDRRERQDRDFSNKPGQDRGSRPQKADRNSRPENERPQNNKSDDFKKQQKFYRNRTFNRNGKKDGRQNDNSHSEG